MIRLEKDSNGIININNLNVNVDIIKPQRSGLKFVKDDKTYFFKKCNNYCLFKELLASKVASTMGIKHACYEKATYNGEDGVICSAVNKGDEEFISLWDMKKILKLNSVGNSIDSMNKRILPKICPTNKEEEFDKFMDIINFDILLGNSDRNVKNIGFIKSGDNYSIAPIFDNEEIANTLAIDEHSYSFDVTNRKFDGLNHDTIIDLFKNKNYGYYLSDALNVFSLYDLYDLVDNINSLYPNCFDKDFEIFILDEIKRNIKILKEYKYEYYDESKMLRKNK
jgi:hypothetical protein